MINDQIVDRGLVVNQRQPDLMKCRSNWREGVWRSGTVGWFRISRPCKREIESSLKACLIYNGRRRCILIICRLLCQY